MILKDKQLINAKTPTSIAGQQQEQDVAFYLRRAFKDHEQVLVINDFSFSHNDENAQIDHLIIYPFGFILIESKSISGEVKVNKFGEWTRSIGKKWTGMPSPIKQVELQQKLFREYLYEHRASILPKLFGIRQQSFGMRCWHNLCAVSSNSIIERESMPKAISNQIVKSEFLADKVNSLMNLKNKVVSTLTFDTRPDFSRSELDSISSFLLGSIQPAPNVKTKDSPKTGPLESNIKCKKCGESIKLSAQYGRYGYYVNCSECDTNTSMKTTCPHCQSANTKVAKRKSNYSLNCFDCSNSTLIIQTD
ncbi:NERD domain-containing protein [Thalassotalea fusca]